MSIRLSGAQKTRILEIVDDFYTKHCDTYSRITPGPDCEQYLVEDLVEAILKEVVPECNPSELLTQKEQRSVNI
jgi:hypothetical protein